MGKQFWLALVFGCVMAATSGLQASDLSGHWTGTWQSDTTGHHGPLRCTLTRIDDSHYRADFAGRFFKILPFRYSVDLEVMQEGDLVLLAGDHTLGRRLGVFHYDAEATCTDFVATYSSCKDQGTFTLSRCTSTCNSPCTDACSP